MGFDVHITRATNWTDNQGHEIPAEEWSHVIATDPDLASDPAGGPLAALWTAHPESAQEAWLDWYDGNIYSTNPDHFLIAKMVEIAQTLAATVQDDDMKPLGKVVSADA